VDGKIHVFQKGQRIPAVSWASFDSWLVSEIARLRVLFDKDGKAIAVHDICRTCDHC
jgi:hypothetical protein